jgi:formate hydrogenlyase subunit 4
LDLLVFFQPFRDAFKLFSRKQYFPLVSNYSIYYSSPIFCFFSLSLLVSLLVPYLSGFISFKLGLFFYWLVPKTLNSYDKNKKLDEKHFFFV